MKNETKEVLRADLEDCLRHLGERFETAYPKGSKGLAHARLPMAEFCNVTVHTVYRWLSPSGVRKPPVGETFIKLVCYLELYGYRVTGREGLNDSVRNFADLIGFGILDPLEAARTLGYGDTSTMYVVLRGQGKPLADKLDRMWQVWKEHREQLEGKKEEARVKYALNFSGESARLLEPKPEKPKTVAPKNPEAAAVDIMNGLLKLFDAGLFGEKLPDNLNREGISTIMNLTVHLTRLSSRLMAVRKE